MKAIDWLSAFEMLRIGAEAAQDGSGQWQATKALMSRSVRVLMEGWVRVPGDVLVAI